MCSTLSLEDYFKTSLYEMSNYSSDKTGLSHGTSLWLRVETNDLCHAKYRVKFVCPQKGETIFEVWEEPFVQVDGQWIPIGSDLKEIQDLIKGTHQALKDHIDGTIDSGDLSAKLEAYARRK